MGFSVLHVLLWLVAAFSPTTQDLASLSVSPKITAACGQQVALHCDVSSSHHGLSIKHMSWSQNHTTLCSVDSKETIRTHRHHFMSEFTCDYRQGELSVIFKEVQPMESGPSSPFRCMLHSNKGAPQEYTTVELEECAGEVKGFWKDGRPTCTFTRVYPGGELHWFHGSNHLRHEHNTSIHVENGGWLTIHSYMERKNLKGTFNCSLRSAKTGRYIASTLVWDNRGRSLEITSQPGNGAGIQAPMKTFLFVLVSLGVALK